jgi:hypothetical protein
MKLYGGDCTCAVLSATHAAELDKLDEAYDSRRGTERVIFIGGPMHLWEGAVPEGSRAYDFPIYTSGGTGDVGHVVARYVEGRVHDPTQLIEWRMFFYRPEGM